LRIFFGNNLRAQLVQAQGAGGGLFNRGCARRGLEAHWLRASGTQCRSHWEHAEAA